MSKELSPRPKRFSEEYFKIFERHAPKLFGCVKEWDLRSDDFKVGYLDFVAISEEHRLVLNAYLVKYAPIDAFKGNLWLDQAVNDLHIFILKSICEKKSPFDVFADTYGGYDGGVIKFSDAKTYFSDIASSIGYGDGSNTVHDNVLADIYRLIDFLKENIKAYNYFSSLVEDIEHNGYVRNIDSRLNNNDPDLS